MLTAAQPIRSAPLQAPRDSSPLPADARGHAPAGAGMWLAAAEEELARCNRCGFCMAGCPTYQVTGLEWAVTRGRVALVKELANGRASWDDASLPVDTCLMCRACVSHCPPQVQIDKIIAAARAARTAALGLHPVQKLFFRTLLPHPGLLRALAWLGGALEAVGVRRMAERSGLVDRLPPPLRAAHRVGPPLPMRSGRALLAHVHRAEQRRWQAARAAGKLPRARVAYFIGCAKDLVFGHAARATYRVLAANEVEVVLVDHPCCGLPARSGGDPDAEAMMARRNVAAFRALDVDAIVCDEGSCTAHLKEYGGILAGTPQEDDARRVADLVLDLTQFLARLGPAPMGPLPPLDPADPARPPVLTWHDPCHLRHYLGVSDEPRALLRRIPGARFVEAGLADWCCGGAGTFMLTQPDLSDEILRRKMDAFLATGADYVVSGSPSCMIQLLRGVRDFAGRADAEDDPPAAGRPEAAAPPRLRALYLSEALEMAYDAAGWKQDG